jgi:hypothetical protein
MDYGRMQASVNRILGGAGADVILNSAATGEYNAATGQATVTFTAHPSYAVLLDYKQRDIDGTLVKQGDQIAYMPPSVTASPKTGDTLTIQGVDWKVVQCKPLAPGQVSVLYELQIRK